MSGGPPDPGVGGNRLWHAVTANFAVVATALTLLGSSIAFFVQRHDEQQQHQDVARQEAATGERGSKKFFLEMQLSTYTDAIKLVSHIATEAQNGPVPDGDRQAFADLYYGSLALVEDEDVEKSMVLFDRGLNGPPACRSELTQISLTVSHCMRKSLAEGWGFKTSSKYCRPDAMDGVLSSKGC